MKLSNMTDKKNKFQCSEHGTNYIPSECNECTRLWLLLEKIIAWQTEGWATNNYRCTKHIGFAFPTVNQCELCRIENKRHFAKKIYRLSIDKSNSKVYSKR